MVSSVFTRPLSSVDIKGDFRMDTKVHYEGAHPLAVLLTGED